jgi:hypothetical protein
MRILVKRHCVRGKVQVRYSEFAHSFQTSSDRQESQISSLSIHSFIHLRNGNQHYVYRKHILAAGSQTSMGLTPHPQSAHRQLVKSLRKYTYVY